MTVTAPPRPPRPTDLPVHEPVPAPEPSEALIEEARRRARRRRRWYGVCALFGAAVAALVAFARVGGGSAGAPRAAAGAPAQAAGTAAALSRIAFSKWSANPNANGADYPTIYTMNADGTDLRRLTRDIGPAWPALSPDGRKIAFETNTWSNGPIDVINADGSDRHLLVLHGLRPAWSPDGTRIAYWVGGSSSHTGIYVIGANGGRPRRLTADGTYPAWSPDGKQIVYAGCTAASSTQGLCVINADGTGQHVVARPGGISAWSPDGTKIAYQNGFPDVRISVINADGTGLRILPPHISYKNQDCNLAWSPDGTQIAFSPGHKIAFSTAPGKQIALSSALSDDIYVINADGTNITKLKGGNNGCGVTWQPIRRPRAR